MFETSLYDTTSICVNAQGMDLVCKGVEDEVDVLGFTALDSFLDDMIPILILDASDHLFLEFADQSCLLIVEDVVQSLDCVLA